MKIYNTLWHGLQKLKKKRMPSMDSSICAPYISYMKKNKRWTTNLASSQANLMVLVSCRWDQCTWLGAACYCLHAARLSYSCRPLPRMQWTTCSYTIERMLATEHMTRPSSILNKNWKWSSSHWLIAFSSIRASHKVFSDSQITKEATNNI